jgi:hypothetical protein
MPISGRFLGLCCFDALGLSDALALGSKSCRHNLSGASVMRRLAVTLAVTAVFALTLALPATLVSAQQSPAPKKVESLPKAAAGEKVCRHKFPDGTPQAWVCKKEEPCCAWDEIRYVKCGSTIFKCL